MSRPRKSILSDESGKSLEVELNPVSADTPEAKKRLSEGYELVAYFIGLSWTSKRRRQENGGSENAA